MNRIKKVKDWLEFKRAKPEHVANEYWNDSKVFTTVSQIFVTPKSLDLKGFTKFYEYNGNTLKRNDDNKNNTTN